MENHKYIIDIQKIEREKREKKLKKIRPSS